MFIADVWQHRLIGLHESVDWWAAGDSHEVGWGGGNGVSHARWGRGSGGGLDDEGVGGDEENKPSDHEGGHFLLQLSEAKVG